MSDIKEVDRKASQALADVEALYDITQTIDRKVTRLQAEMRRGFEAVDERFGAVDQRFDGMDQRFDGMDQRFDGVDQQFVGVNQMLKAIFQKLDAK